MRSQECIAPTRVHGRASRSFAGHTRGNSGSSRGSPSRSRPMRLRERGRDLAPADLEADVVADPPVGERPAPRRGRRVSRRAVHGEKVERDGVARRHVERRDVVLVAPRVDVGHRVERFALALVVDPDELLRQERLPPAMRSRHQLQAHRAGHGIERCPEAHGPGPVDAVVGQIVMPRRARLGLRLLHQHVLVEEPRGARIHEPGGHLRRRGVEHEVAVLGDARPVAVVAEEVAFRAFRLVLLRVRPGRAHVSIDAGAEHVDPLRERAFEVHHAVAPERFGGGVVDTGGCGSRRGRARLMRWSGCRHSGGSGRRGHDVSPGRRRE